MQDGRWPIPSWKTFASAADHLATFALGDWARKCVIGAGESPANPPLSPQVGLIRRDYGNLGDPHESHPTRPPSKLGTTRSSNSSVVESAHTKICKACVFAATTRRA
jgi:hypothetical protein